MLALDFIAKLEFVSSNDLEVQGNKMRYKFDRHSPGFLVSGSEKRVPHGHWTKYFNSNEDSNSKERPTSSSAVNDALPLAARRYSLIGAPKEENTEDTEDSHGDAVFAKFVPIINIASKSSSFLENLVSATARTKQYSVFESEVVKALIEFKWQSYAKRLFLQDMWLYITMVLSLTLDALCYNTVKNSEIHDAVKVMGHLPMLISFCLCVYFLQHERHQISLSGSLIEHMKDTWNALDVISLSSIFLAYIARFMEIISVGGTSTNQVSLPILAFALPVAYLNTLYFMQVRVGERRERGGMQGENGVRSEATKHAM